MTKITTSNLKCFKKTDSAHSRTPMSDYDWQTNSGERFNYLSYGVAVSEVQIDTLTGDHVVSNQGNMFS